MKLRFTLRATRDIAEIAEYLRTRNPSAALAVRDAILRSLRDQSPVAVVNTGTSNSSTITDFSGSIRFPYGWALNDHPPSMEIVAEAERLGKKFPWAWISRVRPSRRPLSRPPQDDEFSLFYQRPIVILRSARRVRLEGRKAVL